MKSIYRTVKWEDYGIDLNEKYISIAEKRIKNTLVQQELEI
jgi:hypothetical protein